MREEQRHLVSLYYEILNGDISPCGSVGRLFLTDEKHRNKHQENRRDYWRHRDRQFGGTRFQSQLSANGRESHRGWMANETLYGPDILGRFQERE